MALALRSCPLQYLVVFSRLRWLGAATNMITVGGHKEVTDNPYESPEVEGSVNTTVPPREPPSRWSVRGIALLNNLLAFVGWMAHRAREPGTYDLFGLFLFLCAILGLSVLLVVACVRWRYHPELLFSIPALAMAALAAYPFVST